ncbi:hypothetical protein EJ110_NYTH30226 [Nymphaea thermarum]|nr:hypothetical protein EJ110_NYTH30226 [Nymphaea thermarum]
MNLEGVVEVNDKACQPDPDNAPSPTSFDRTLRDLLSSLTSYATHENSSLPLFATGTSKHELPNMMRHMDWCSGAETSLQSMEGVCRMLSLILQNAPTGSMVLTSSGVAAAWLMGRSPSFSASQCWCQSVKGSINRKPWWTFLIIGAATLVLLAAACALCLLWVRRRHLGT